MYRPNQKGFSQITLIIIIAGVIILGSGVAYFAFTTRQAPDLQPAPSRSAESSQSAPPDLTPYARPLEPDDRNPEIPTSQPKPSDKKRIESPRSSAAFFPIGMYCVESQNDLPELDKGGFNLIQDYRFEGVDTATDEEAKAYLDAAQRLGMRILMGIQQEAVLDNRLDVIEKRIRALKDHPALFGWQLFDEPENAAALAKIYEKPVTVSPATFKNIYTAIKKIDPAHPVLLVPATGLDETYEYLDGADTIMLQYGAPLPGIYDYPYDSLENVMPLLKSDARFLATKGKPFILNTAAYNIANDPLVWPKDKPKSLGRYPTKEEIRFVAYYSLIQGGDGVIINCYRFPASEGFSAEDISSTSPTPKGRKQWQVVSGIASELKAMSPILLAPNSDNRVIIEPENTGIEFMTKEYQNKLYMIAANPSATKKSATFTLPLNMVSVQVQSESRSINIKGGGYTDSFDGYDAHVYEIVH